MSDRHASRHYSPRGDAFVSGYTGTETGPRRGSAGVSPRRAGLDTEGGRPVPSRGGDSDSYSRGDRVDIRARGGRFATASSATTVPAEETPKTPKTGSGSDSDSDCPSRYTYSAAPIPSPRAYSQRGSGDIPPILPRNDWRGPAVASTTARASAGVRQPRSSRRNSAAAVSAAPAAVSGTRAAYTAASCAPAAVPTVPAVSGGGGGSYSGSSYGGGGSSYSGSSYRTGGITTGSPNTQDVYLTPTDALITEKLVKFCAQDKDDVDADVLRGDDIFKILCHRPDPFSEDGRRYDGVFTVVNRFLLKGQYFTVVPGHGGYRSCDPSSKASYMTPVDPLVLYGGCLYASLTLPLVKINKVPFAPYFCAPKSVHGYPGVGDLAVFLRVYVVDKFGETRHYDGRALSDFVSNLRRSNLRGRALAPVPTGAQFNTKALLSDGSEKPLAIQMDTYRCPDLPFAHAAAVRAGQNVHIEGGHCILFGCLVWDLDAGAPLRQSALPATRRSDQAGTGEGAASLHTSSSAAVMSTLAASVSGLAVSRRGAGRWKEKIGMLGTLNKSSRAELELMEQRANACRMEAFDDDDDDDDDDDSEEDDVDYGGGGGRRSAPKTRISVDSVCRFCFEVDKEHANSILGLPYRWRYSPDDSVKESSCVYVAHDVCVATSGFAGSWKLADN